MLESDEMGKRRQEEAVETLRECLATVKPPDAIYEKIVDVLWGPGAGAGADKVHAFLDEELEEHPDRVLLLDLKARTFVRQRKPDDAAALLDDAIAKHSNRSELYLAKARFFESVKKPDEAAQMIAVAKEKAPKAREPTLFELGFLVRQKKYDELETTLGALAKLGVPADEIAGLRERTTFDRQEVSCVTVGQGPAAASLSRTIPMEDVQPHKGFWTGAAVQQGFIVNRCGHVTVDAAVNVTFHIRQITQLFIFVEVRSKTQSSSFVFKQLAPGEARPFSASTSLGALELGESGVGTLGGVGTADTVAGVSVSVRVLSPVF